MAVNVCIFCKTVYLEEHSAEDCRKFSLEIIEGRKAKRKAKAQRAKDIKRLKIEKNKAKRNAHPTVEKKSGLNWEREKLPELNEEDPVVLYLKSCVLPNHECVDIKFIRPPSHKSPKQMIQFSVRKTTGKVKPIQNFFYNYKVIKQDLDSGRLTIKEEN